MPFSLLRQAQHGLISLFPTEERNGCVWRVIFAASGNIGLLFLYLFNFLLGLGDVGLLDRGEGALMILSESARLKMTSAVVYLQWLRVEWLFGFPELPLADQVLLRSKLVVLLHICVHLLRHLQLLFSPNHLVDDADVGLDDLHDLGGDILLDVVWNRDAVVAVAAEGDCCVNCLEK